MYHQLVHLLDLCTYSYQLHNQTLIWPMDPYYDQLSGPTGRRNGFMAEVHNRAANPQGPYAGKHGPGVLNGLPPTQTNRGLDPIISDYNQIDPWQPSVVRPNRETEGWILYNTPKEITQRLKWVRLARYDSGSDAQNPQVKLHSIPGLGQDLSRPDRLYCFEGGTGGIERNKKKPAWAVMGLVLARKDDSAPKIPGNTSAHPYPYDVYIVFRGSRSGDPRALRALREEKGNPDWVTDMDFGAGRGVVGKISDISETGSVSPGFAASVTTMLPTVMACLDDIQTKITYPPRTIYVTGHSLAAALAVHFTSAVLLGRTYGYTVSGSKMPDAIRRWPWSSTQLVPFALPVVGDETSRDAFDIRLASRPVYLSGDPVTQRSRQYAVGWPYRIVPESVSNLKQRGGRISSLRHEPFNIRKYLIKDLQSKKILSDPLPQDFPGEPWIVYKTFKNLLKTSGLMGDVKQILGANFNTRLTEYLEVLFACVGQNEKPRVRIVIDAVNNINVLAVNNIWGPYPLVSHKTISQIYTDSNGIFPSDTDFDKFIGLCLFLSAASKLQYSVADAAIGIVPFDSLTLK